MDKNINIEPNPEIPTHTKAEVKDKITKKPSITNIKLDQLIPYHDHPFKLYEGNRLKDLVESIAKNGVLTPIVVRRINDGENKGKYEILSGHNRVNASKEVDELKTIPAVIREDLTDEEADLIVIETNFVQRSIKDMRHSELSEAITRLYNTLKKTPGYRSDLVEALNKLEVGEATGSQVGKRKNSMTKAGEEFGLSKNDIYRYLQINRLSSELKERLDDGKISKGAAVDLSSLREHEQELVNGLLGEDGRVTLGQAKTLKEESKKGELDKAVIEAILKPSRELPVMKSVKLNADTYSKFFKEGTSPEEVEEEITKALELYRSQQEQE